LVAVTVKVEGLPAVIEAGLAVILTVGIPGAATVKVALTVVFPPAPVATAV